ncbi:TetR/AcrR family transcriptional regulator [Leifsonia sp. L25]|uniref:TetR/AcrR family transcriptional regulator n=1 Tax=Leifsonia sp. L25 TaxID=3423957 RepID=UPI003D6829F5
MAARAGLSRRAVYGHFATRDELLVEVFTRGARRLAALLDPVSHPDPWSRSPSSARRCGPKSSTSG